MVTSTSFLPYFPLNRLDIFFSTSLVIFDGKKTPIVLTFCCLAACGNLNESKREDFDFSIHHAAFV